MGFQGLDPSRKLGEVQVVDLQEPQEQLWGTYWTQNCANSYPNPWLWCRAMAENMFFFLQEGEGGQRGLRPPRALVNSL